jgi:nitrate/nitrite transport system substrate-binding protein
MECNTLVDSGDPKRDERRLLGEGSAAPAVGAVADSAAWAAGSDAPEKKTVRIGFMPLTDCASVVMASVLGFDRRHGVQIELTREMSWAGVRDKLVSGDLDMAQVLYGLVYGVHLGVGGPRKDMAVLMTLNQNGQGLTVSRQLADQGAVDGAGLARLVGAERRKYTFAQTFPTGTHAMWLYYWLASHGVDPFNDAKVVTVAPRQMAAQMRSGKLDAFCVGEPWNHRALIDGIGISAATSQQVWPDHPEKVLGSSAAFVDQHPSTSRAVIMAVLEASRWIDASPQNRQRAAETIAGAAFVDTCVDAISQRMQGRYQDGLGRSWHDPNAMQFFADGRVNYPYLSDGMWFLTQHKRWGLLAQHPDYLNVAKAVNRTRLYDQAASQLGVAVPASAMRRSRLIDGVLWDGSDPAAYADGFAVRHAPPLPVAA